MENLEQNLLKYNLNNKKFIVFDFEVVEGLNVFYSRPHQLSWSIYNGSVYQETYNFYLKWETPFRTSKKAAEITRFSQEKIDKEGVAPFLAFELFSKFIYNTEYYIVGSNTLNYDVMIFSNSCKKLGLRCDYSFLKRCYDVNALFKAWKLNRKINNENLLSFQFSCNNFVRKGLKSSVGYMSKEFGFELDETRAHEAEYDTQKEIEIFFELIKKIDLE